MEHPRGMYVSVCMYVCTRECLRRAWVIEVEEKEEDKDLHRSPMFNPWSFFCSCSCFCICCCRSIHSLSVPVIIRNDGSSITCLPSCTCTPTLCTVCHPESYSYICRKWRYHSIHSFVPILLVTIEREVMIPTTYLFLDIFRFFVPAEISVSDALLSAIA